MALSVRKLVFHFTYGKPKEQKVSLSDDTILSIKSSSCFTCTKHVVWCRRVWQETSFRFLFKISEFQIQQYKEEVSTITPLISSWLCYKDVYTQDRTIYDSLRFLSDIFYIFYTFLRTEILSLFALESTSEHFLFHWTKIKNRQNNSSTILF